MDPGSGAAVPPEGTNHARFPDLAGRSGIVTGASQGIGAGIAAFLGRQGMTLTLAARSTEAGEKVTADLRAAGAEVQWVTADLTDGAGAQRVLDAATGRFGRVDVLVNNAANKGSKAFEELDAEAYAGFEASVRMLYELSYRVVQHMKQAGGGAIVNISSVGGLRAHRRLAGYDAAKGAMDALTRSMAVDLAPYGIRVNAVAPGATLSRPDDPRWLRSAARRGPYIPLGRLASREEIAAAAAFFASDASANTTGQILYVDGGLTVQLTPPGIRV